MVKEELYIIVDGERKQLDLLSPSGITLNFVSNLFNDLSKINASYSYTFKLPRTANNVRVLEIVDDVRADGKFTRIKNDAEYVYDGVSLFSNANMYISGVDKDSISAVLTWNVNKGLQELEKHNMSLQELGNHRQEGEYDYVGDEASGYEKDKVVKVAGWENNWLTFNKMSEYNPTYPAFRSLHNAAQDRAILQATADPLPLGFIRKQHSGNTGAGIQNRHTFFCAVIDPTPICGNKNIADHFPGQRQFTDFPQMLV